MTNKDKWLLNDVQKAKVNQEYRRGNLITILTIIAAALLGTVIRLSL